MSGSRATTAGQHERRRGSLLRRASPLVAPLLVGAAVLAAWEAVVRWREIPAFTLPPPSLIARSIVEHGDRLFAAWCVTFGVMAVALAVAVVGGVMMAVVFASSRLVELSLFPLAVVLQVTPLVAIAPLLLIWLFDYPWLVKLICAWIVAFFPILSNTVVGLRSADPGLANLLRIYGASPWQRVRLLLAPSALPYFLAGLRVAVNLALVGAVVAEFVTGAATEHPGLATLMYEGQENMNIRLTFAALAVLSVTGVTMYFATHQLSRLLLGRWHESGVDSRNR